MPDVISDVHSMNLTGVEDFMDEEQSVNGDPLLSHHLLNSPHSPSGGQNHNNNNGHNYNMSNHNGNTNQQHMNHHMNHNHLTNNILGLDGAHMNGDPMFSGSSNPHSTVDINCIDPIITNYTLLTSNPRSNCDNRNVVDALLQSDNDSLVSDIDMVA